MKETIQAVYGEKSLGHNPPFDIYRGLQEPSFDIPERSTSIILALQNLSKQGDARIHHPKIFDINYVLDVHSADYLDFIKLSSAKLQKETPVRLPRIIDGIEGKVEIVQYPPFMYPSVYPHGENPKSNNNISDRGKYAFDMSTPVLPNTYEVALEAANCALTGADMLIHGQQYVYVLTRPPGHHAEKDKMGGYCYLNNAAIAANYIQKETNRNVGILDIDAHHGNGTQQIFYDTDKVSYASLHINPSLRPPYYSGYDDENGNGKGVGFNLNIPLPLETGDEIFLKNVDRLIESLMKNNPKYLVVSLGFDTAQDDPLGLFNISPDCYKAIARRLGSTELPILSIQEGGYNTDTLGENVALYLKSLTNE